MGRYEGLAGNYYGLVGWAKMGMAQSADVARPVLKVRGPSRMGEERFFPPLARKGADLKTGLTRYGALELAFATTRHDGGGTCPDPIGTPPF